MKSALTSALLVGLAISGARADVLDTPVVDLNTGDTFYVCGTTTCGGSELNGTADFGEAIFTVLTTSPTGSGYINPFLRFQHNEQSGNGNDVVETAYNTDSTDLQSLNDPHPGSGYDYENQAKDTTAGGWKEGDFNRAILFDDLVIDQDGYISFYLDINEPNEAGKTTLRLDELSFFISTTNTLNLYDPEWDGSNADPNGDPADPACDSTALNTAGSAGCFYGGSGVKTDKVWDMDLSTLYGAIILDNSNGTAGSGDYDLQVRLDASVFDAFVLANNGSTAGLYVYLENTAGLADDMTDADTTYQYGGEAQAGFEEWAVDEKRPVPVPGTLALAGLGLMLLGRRLFS